MLGIGGWEIIEGGSNCFSYDVFMVENGVLGLVFERFLFCNVFLFVDYCDNNISFGGYSWFFVVFCYGNIMMVLLN